MWRPIRSTVMGFSFALCAAQLGLGPAGAQETLRAAAVVNDQIISLLDVNQRILLTALASGVQDSEATRRRLLSQVMRNLIDERLQAQEAERLDIKIEDAQIEGAIDTIAAQNKMTRAQFDDLTRQRGVLPESLADQVRAQLTWRALIARRLQPSIQVTEEEIEEVAARVQANQGATIRRISEIFLSVESPDQEEEVRQNALRILEQLRARAEFGAVAKQFSQSATALRSGDVGWVQKGQLPDEIDAALATARPGEIVGPIRTITGYHIVLLREERQTAGAETTLDLKQILFAVPAGAGAEQTEAALARARQAREEIAGCDSADQLARSLGSPGSGDLGQMKLSELPPPVREAVGGLAVGQASQPVVLPSGVSVLIVCDRVDAGIDRRRIRERLVDERLNMQARRFMRDLRRDANVDIRI